METLPATRVFDLNLIRVLDAVISAGNATKASKRLNVTPAAVSLALQRLQHTYNESLFIRTKDGLVPTARAKELHHTFVQILELVDTTFHPGDWLKLNKEMIICGNDITEQYFLSQIIEFDIFDQYKIHHRSNWLKDITSSRELLKSGTADLVMTFEPPKDNDFSQVVVERFTTYCVVCSLQNPLSSLSKISLHNFYSFRHAEIRNDVFKTSLFDERHLMLPCGPYTGHRTIGYRSESLNGLLSMVENTAMIAVLPKRLASFYKAHRNYAIEIVSLPDEIKVKPLSLYAVWSQRNKLQKDIYAMVSMLQTIASFRS
ncbi:MULTISPECIES: LysR family transcriptional regulator [Enterobacterales]|uniref:LysR family transcriptional regulator n=1 Tax=Enterobacterales TaxID=91347 RepID=UPI002ED8C6CF